MRTSRPKGEGEQWAEHLRSIVEHNGRALATVEVVGDQLGSQTRGKRRRPLDGVRYDGKTDVLEFVIGGSHEWPVRCFIVAPRTFNVVESGDKRVVIVGDASGARTLIRFFGVDPVPVATRAGASRAIAHKTGPRGVRRGKSC
jgi:hypothetical protein